MEISAEQVIETIESATDENRVDSLRQHQMITLPAAGEFWITGDLHDHRRNFDKFIRTADLPNHPDRHIALHEVIHGDHFDANGAEDSWRSIYRAAELKCDFSSQVHFVLANHDLAQIYGEGISKAGINICKAFRIGLKRDFGTSYARVEAAITEFLLSLPLAIRSPNGIFFCHSLPTDAEIPSFDFTVFDRPLVTTDYQRRTGPVYQLIWGRETTPNAAAAFADKMAAKIVVSGHQRQDNGFSVNGDRHIILASDHSKGVFLPLSLTENYTMPTLAGRIKKFVEIE